MDVLSPFSTELYRRPYTDVSDVGHNFVCVLICLILVQNSKKRFSDKFHQHDSNKPINIVRQYFTKLHGVVAVPLGTNPQKGTDLRTLLFMYQSFYTFKAYRIEIEN